MKRYWFELGQEEFNLIISEEDEEEKKMNLFDFAVPYDIIIKYPAHSFYEFSKKLGKINVYSTRLEVETTWRYECDNGEENAHPKLVPNDSE